MAFLLSLKMTFGQQVLSFYRSLDNGPRVPEEVEVLYPHQVAATWSLMKQFYNKYYNDEQSRVFLIGINPGRHGAGLTGVPFTDPIRLAEVCGIDNNFAAKPELSSRFIYKVIAAMGGVNQFYQSIYITSVSPYGFTKAGKNLNYYDIRELQESWEPFMVNCLRQQIKMGAKPIAFSLGQGKNLKYLQKISQQYDLFEEVRPLPHPRWVMQYRLKRIDEFIDLYRNKLTAFW